ncbi:annexin B10 isoform X2 [Cephus cinctus]|uniref:Annexin n=1 Tax=Cephus cinctus TaxID=211228 RepID=A0AAJ7RRM3_CEPCN|nr:annexin B10 isoform X2 [Cephus cinctus]
MRLTPSESMILHGIGDLSRWYQDEIYINRPGKFCWWTSRIQILKNHVQLYVSHHTRTLLASSDSALRAPFPYSFHLSRILLPFQPEPTLKPAADFNAAEDGVALRTAMKGFGTDEQAIIDILTARSNEQRQRISNFFTQEYGRNLIEDLKSELGGHFEDVIVALMIPPVDYMAKQLHKAMDGIGTEEETLVEILCSRDNREIAEIVEAYERLYDRPLAEHLCSETSGDFRRLLTLIVTGVRNGNNDVHPERARESAEMLYNAGEAKLGTDEEIFNKILAHECFAQLRLIFEEYKSISGRTIEQALRDEISGELKDAMLAIVECVQSPPAFFAKRLRKAMEGAGTDDMTLIRIIVSRAEIDLGNIKREYERLYDKTLESSVKKETSGDYKRALVALIGGP